jgi:hypothetical protein
VLNYQLFYFILSYLSSLFIPNHPFIFLINNLIMVQLGFDFRLTILFELIIRIIWIDSWTAEHMTSKKIPLALEMIWDDNMV